MEPLTAQNPAGAPQDRTPKPLHFADRAYARGRQGSNITPNVLGAEQLVGDARSRRPQRMTRRERTVMGTSALCYVAAAVAAAFLIPIHRTVDPALIAGLVAGYALVSRVRFEFGGYYVVPEQLMLVPMYLLAPLPLVPLLAGVSALVAMTPDLVNRTWHRDRGMGSLGDSWYAFGPTLVLVALAPVPPSFGLVEVYLLAFAAQMLTDFAWTAVRNQLLDGLPFRALVRDFAGTARLDLILSPIAFVAALAAYDEPAALLVLAPLAYLLHLFARDRHEHHSSALELQRAYRGTVMLLADVVEFEDKPTADHSRSVVELVGAVANEMGVRPEQRQALEFAAMLHDVGKIAIPREILHKPASLTPKEYELIKTHTVEGQFMLDRVGGVLGSIGEIVRSCHERWDGGGYPDGLVGEQIPVAARIVFACDAYNAMTTDRVYRAALPRERALAELAANTGTQFDPTVVASLVKVVEQGEPAPVTSGAVRSILARSKLKSGLGSVA